MIENYTDLIVWQKSMDLVVKIYEIVKLLPVEERYALSDQMRRAAVSVPSNIAEGFMRDSAKDYSRFLAISVGSCAELLTQIDICVRLNFCSQEDVKDIKLLITEISKMLMALRRKLTPKA